jgi:hypothetical protein
MNTSLVKLVGSVAVASAIVVGVIFSLRNFDANKIACNKINETRLELQSLYDSGVTASVQVYAEAKAEAEAQLSQCINAKPVDPCAEAQAQRDNAVANYNNIPAPANEAPYADMQAYFKKRDEAYTTYKTAKATLDACRLANPPKPVVAYEQSDTKACFDAYDKNLAQIQTTFDQNTQAMRTALNTALAGLTAREKACHPPKGKEKFTDPPQAKDDTNNEVSENLLSCRPVNANLDSELLTLRKRAGEISAELPTLQTSIDNIQKRMNPLQRALTEVDTYIPPESTKTQYEGALNALRAERKVSIESALEFYKNLLARKVAEQQKLTDELKTVEAQITARLAKINQENAERNKKFPTALHLAKPDKCDYYHCHGLLCGKPDPKTDGCGHGSTTEDDVDCKKFFDSYLQSAGVN